MEKVVPGVMEYRKVYLFGRWISKEVFIGIISGIVGIIFFVLLFKLGIIDSTTKLVLFSMISLIISVSPPLIYRYFSRKEISEIEMIYPKFLIDLSDALSSGMTLLEAINMLSKENYQALTKYLRKLNVWLSWGMPFDKAFEKMNGYFKDSRVIQQVNGIILEAYRSGGDISKTLLMVADDMEDIVEIEKEKEARLKQQVLFIYVIYIIFIVIVYLLVRILLPVINLQAQMTSASVFGLNLGRGVSIEFLKTLLMFSLFIQAIFSGITAGIIEKNSIISGLRHSLVLVIVAVLFSAIALIQPTLSVNVSHPKKVAYEFPFKISGTVLKDGSPVKDAVVKIYLDGELKDMIVTDDNGAFSTEIIAPREKGEHIILVKVSYKNLQAEKESKITVE